MNEQQELKQDPVSIDKKRVAIALVGLAVLLGVGAVWAKEALPNFLAEKNTQLQQKTAEKNSSGQVAGEQIDEQKEELQKQIQEIKTNVTNLKPEDIKQQAPVQKILGDLDELAKKASESAKILDVKGNLCEEAKKRF